MSKFKRIGQQTFEYTGIPKATQYDLLKKNKLPPPVKISERIRGWHTDVLDKLLKGEL